MTDYPRKYVFVWTKWRWQNAWSLNRYIIPLQCSLAASPGVGTAKFQIPYGSGFWEDYTAMLDGEDIAGLSRAYIQITVAEEDNPLSSTSTVWWTGIIPAEQFKLMGQRVKGGFVVKTADQVIQAFGLETLLDTRLDTAWVRQGTVVRIDSLPAFNRKLRSGGIVGNRSSTRHRFDDSLEVFYTHVFGTEDTWTNWDILEYLIEHYQIPRILCGPRFGLTVRNEVREALEDIVDAYNFEGMTLRQAINQLVSRARGFAWAVDWTIADDADGKGGLFIWSLLDEDLTIGDYSIPAHAFSDRTTLQLWDEKSYIDVDITHDTREVYDKIIVRGAMIKSVGTWSMSDLQTGWTAAEQTAFEDAAEGTTGYSSLTDDEKKVINDKYRSTDRFQRVFTTFVVPDDWDWTLDGQIVAPRFDPKTGDWRFQEPLKANYWNVGKRFLPLLPFKEGWDYSGSDAVNRNPAGTEADYRRMFALLKDDSGRYGYAEKLPDRAATVRTLQDQLGVEVRFRPSYLLAKNHFSGAQPASLEPEYDYDDLLVTAMIETDQYLQLEHTLVETDVEKTLVISVPDAELWIVTPGTVADVDAEGNPVEYLSTQEIRDDRDTLRSILAAAVAWYGKRRNKLSVSVKRLEAVVHLGQMIESVNVSGFGSAGTCVTNIDVDFQRNTYTFRTDFAELDIRRLVGLSGAGGQFRVPTLRVAGAKIGRLEAEQSQIRRELNKQPLRFEGSGSSGGGQTVTAGMALFRVTSARTSNFYNCRRQVVDHTDWDTGGAVDRIDDLNTDNVVVFNVAENGLATVELTAGDLLYGWQEEDDEGTVRWLGIPAAHAWWHT
ncbi:MAG: hypothetical protein JXA82_18090 [Sedimentisphaerales bacterium]|nr:hypothetical protein [Sedimentisphaerales bacterium]